MSINVTLVVVGGDVKTTEITPRLPAILGRGRGATILLPHPLVSRQHCELFEANGQLMVKDLGSLNGTYVGQDKITECSLAPGSLLTVGSVTFRAVYELNGAVTDPSVGMSDTAAGMPIVSPMSTPETPSSGSADFSETVKQPESSQAEPTFSFNEPEEESEDADAADDFKAFLKGLEDK